MQRCSHYGGRHAGNSRPHYFRKRDRKDLQDKQTDLKKTQIEIEEAKNNLRITQTEYDERLKYLVEIENSIQPENIKGNVDPNSTI